MVLRDININENIKAGKVLIIYGARRVGKTYLLHSYLGKCGLKYKLDSGDDIESKICYQIIELIELQNMPKGMN